MNLALALDWQNGAVASSDAKCLYLPGVAECYTTGRISLTKRLLKCSPVLEF
jgi:hypothetical protein